MAPDAIAAEVLTALQSGGQVEPFSSRGLLTSIDAAYGSAEALRRLREARGERRIGRKIGFTNRNIWSEYGVRQPIWGDVYDSTLFDGGTHARVEVARLPEPRIEPEIVLGLGSDLKPGMSLAEIVAGITWVAHGFEVVQSIFPDWKFAAVDAVANAGMHGALVVGPRRELDAEARQTFASDLSAFQLTLLRNGEPIDAGSGANVLDGPVQALLHLNEGLAGYGVTLRKGDIITTGTLTRAFPITPGERWSTQVSGYPLPGLTLDIG